MQAQERMPQYQERGESTCLTLQMMEMLSLKPVDLGPELVMVESIWQLQLVAMVASIFVSPA